MTPAKQIRVLILLLLLLPLVFILRMPSNPAPDWTRTLTIAVLPYNADGSAEADSTIAGLSLDDFAPIQRYLNDQAKDYFLPLEQAFRIELLSPVAKAPGLPPSNEGLIAKLKWAIALRWWYWRLDTGNVEPDIIAVARYQASESVPLHSRSIGMPSPRLALVSLSTDPNLQPRNLFVMTHEILHTVGASDHYDQNTGQPIWPSGYADLTNSLRYPQAHAEIMAGRIALAPNRSVEARSLFETRIGENTAADIGWTY